MKTKCFLSFLSKSMLGLFLFLMMSSGQAAQQLTPGVVQGHVYQADGKTPIGGATVEAQGVSEGTPDLSPTSTNPDGSYLLSLPTEGSYTLRAVAPGYARVYYNNVTPSRQATVVNVTAGSSITINFNLTEGGAIAGHIYQSDGVTPIVNAKIFVAPALYLYLDDGFDTRSSSDGSYVVDGLALGQYKVHVIADGFALKFYEQSFTWDTAKNVNVIPPNTTSGIDVKLDLEALITGYVLAADGITPIQGVGVEADGDTLGLGRSGGSNANGSYTIRGLQPDSYTVRISDQSLPGWYTGEFYNSKYTWGTADRVPVAPGQNVMGINFTLDEGGAIVGRIFDKATNQPISGIQVGVTLLNGDGVTPLPVTDFNGNYRINLRPGSYKIQASFTPGYIPQWYQEAFDFNSATPVAVNFKQETSGIDLYLSRPASISGHVYEANGVTPLANANVFAFPVNSQLTGSGANSQPDGSYKIQGLVTGDYVVQVTVTGHVSKNTEVKGVTAPNETPNINFSLETYPYTVKIVGQGIVGTQGGSVNVSDTSSPLLNAGVDVPAGALSANTVIDIGEVDAPAFPPTLASIGSPVHFGPEGLQFAQPVTVKIPYKQADLDRAGVTDPNDLNVYTLNTTTSPPQWELVVGPKTVDTVNHLIMIAVTHFSIYQLGIPAVVVIPGDLNGDGRVDCNDLGIVKASFGKRSGQSGFDPRADVNGDGVVDVRDLATVARNLPAGTKCP